MIHLLNLRVPVSFKKKGYIPTTLFKIMLVKTNNFLGLFPPQVRRRAPASIIYVRLNALSIDYKKKKNQNLYITNRPKSIVIIYIFRLSDDGGD